MLKHTVRQVLLLEEGWRFHLGDIPSPVPNTHIAAYMANKAGWSRGAARVNYDDSDWRVLDLPHDWSVEGEFNPENHVDSGYLPRGIGWYRRHFRLDDADRDKHLALRFDGIATHCTVYVNGHLLHRHFCGYTPITIDISGVAHFGDQLNVVAVRVNATFVEGWWYEGAGVYRHAWLIKTGKVHIAPFGVFVCPGKTNGDNWSAQIETTVANDSDADHQCVVDCEIFDPLGNAVARATSTAAIAARSTAVVASVAVIASPQLWSLRTPRLYRARTTICIDGRIVDDEVTTFGFRTIRFDPDHGFFLNDEPVKLIGTCNHQDHAGVGVAVPDSIQRFRIQRLLEMGTNAYRCAHNPPAPELLDACDELGMLVMDENRTFGSSPEHLAQLRTMVLRDRNHPSVILWSICNEEAIQGTPVAARIARAMQRAVHQLDPSRPVTAAVSGGILNDDSIADAVEVMGINYQLPLHDQYHAKHPRVPLLASETHCGLATRAAFETRPEQFEFADDDSQAARWGATARETWRFISSRPFIAGFFAWTGFDYRGEPTPHAWPCTSSHHGLLDTCGFAKNGFYLHQAFFTERPFVYIAPHWNWQDAEGKSIHVRVYTNARSVELFLAGKSLGNKTIDPIEMAEWDVAYEPGKVEAVAYREDVAVARHSIETTGPAVAVGLEVDPLFDARSIPADGEYAVPITLFATDAAGRRVPTATNVVSLSIDGPATLLGLGNGDPACHEPDKGSSRSLFRGLAQAIVQTTTTPGQIHITATASGLKPGVLAIESTPVIARPSVPAQRVRRFISDWRMSPITRERPNINERLVDQDVNSWDRVDPAQRRQPIWIDGGAFALYQATLTAPKALQAAGGKILFHNLRGTAEIFLDDVAMQAANGTAGGEVQVAFGPTTNKITLSVVVFAESAPAGILGPVELLDR